MTAADHTNTQRWEACKGKVRDAVTKRTIGASEIVNRIDALVAQDEAAEAEIARLRGLNTGLTNDYNALLVSSTHSREDAKAEVARLTEDSDAYHDAMRYADEHLERAEAAEAERDRLAGALREATDSKNRAHKKAAEMERVVMTARRLASYKRPFMGQAFTDLQSAVAALPRTEDTA